MQNPLTMRSNLWNIVLAAGAGRRLASVTGGIPKQFWRAGDGPTLLENTLDRSTSLASPDRTVIVVDRTHASFVQAIPSLRRFDRIAYQPCDRGTAPGVLLGLMPVLATSPDAVVMLTPSDHGIAKPRLFARDIRRAALDVESGQGDVVLFGAAPAGPEGDYGWITPGSGAACAPRKVATFVEKPPPHLARELFASGAVWNTMVLVARASVLLDLYRRHLPAVADVFLGALDRGDRWMDVLGRHYPSLPTADFSRDLIGVAEGLVLRTWPAALGWSDLGTPDRLARWHRKTTTALRQAPFDIAVGLPQFTYGDSAKASAL